MDNILFIVPPHIQYKDFIDPTSQVTSFSKKGINYGSLQTDMPIGILSLSAYIKKYEKVNTKLLNFNVLLNKLKEFNFKSFEEFFESVFSQKEWLDFNPTIIAISSLFTPSYISMLGIAKCCRQFFPKAIITAGGGVPTNMYKDIFSESGCFDALCYGEGELPLLSLVRAENKLKFLESHNSWITKEKIDKGIIFQHELVEDLDEIPFYDYGLCDPADYALNPAIVAYAAGTNEKEKNFHVMTSRGCPFRCCFCSSFTVHGRNMRYYSLGRVKEDFTRLKEIYGAKTLVFQDDQFLIDRQRALKIIEIIKNLNLKAVFQNGLSIQYLERPVLEALKSAGINQLVLSIESGSEKVLKKIMHKPLSLSAIKQVAEDCRSLGIYTNANILIGLPGENKNDIEESRKFLKTIYVNWFLIFCASPLIGTEMHEICKKNNYIKPEFVGSTYKKAVVQTEEFTAEYIQETAYSMNLELNFVENSDFRLGSYQTAVTGFENAIRAKNDHAFAYYYASKCYGKLGNQSKAENYMEVAKTIVRDKPFWRGYATMFNVPI